MSNIANMFDDFDLDIQKTCEEIDIQNGVLVTTAYSVGITVVHPSCQNTCNTNCLW